MGPGGQGVDDGNNTGSVGESRVFQRIQTRRGSRAPVQGGRGGKEEVGNDMGVDGGTTGLYCCVLHRRSDPKTAGWMPCLIGQRLDDVRQGRGSAYF